MQGKIMTQRQQTDPFKSGTDQIFENGCNKETFDSGNHETEFF
jgi:hypothetical protein